MARRGFTLIELLVVVAIIAVLMAVLMPAMQRAREQGKRAACLSNVKQFGVSWVLYADENDQRLVNSCTVENSEGHNDSTEPCWMYFHNDWTDTDRRIDGIKRGAMWPYVKQLKIYKCPTGIRGEVNTYAIVDAMNGAASPMRTFVKELMIKKKTQIKRPGERIVYVDEGKTSVQSWTIFYEQESWWDNPPIRHGAGTNFSFADGHAEYWKWDDNRTLKYGRGEGGLQAAQPGNKDIQRLQRAAWGKLGYTPSTQ
jgi:prepilin-type N-terminal cleavage/methylation domain-containing protein/prepilin-type processing-associated H-X9-DG protein